MTSRYVPNETRCPVAVDLLALLLRSNEARVSEIADTLPVTQRAALAAFCYTRSHMRSLSFTMAAACDEKALREADGSVWEALVAHSRGASTFEFEPKSQVKKGITLARFAA